MDQMMLGISLGALTAAVGLSVLAWRLLVGGQQRAAARIAALEDAARDDDEWAEDFADAPLDPMTPQRHQPLAAPEPVHATLADAAILPGTFSDRAADVAPVSFGAAPTPAVPAHRPAAFAAVATLIGLVVWGTVTIMRSTPVGAAPALTTPRTAPAATATAAPPLELLSLRHTIEPSTLTVTGLVENPATATTAPRVTAVVYAFDDAGVFIASGRADIEFQQLRPGETSAFVVHVPVSSPVTRYRVGFRRDDGSVLPHADRRGQSPTGLTEGER